MQYLKCVKRARRDRKQREAGSAGRLQSAAQAQGEGRNAGGDEGPALGWGSVCAAVGRWVPWQLEVLWPM